MKSEEEWLSEGNEHRRHGSWKQAIECYNKAISLNPESEAVEALKIVIDILEFRNIQIYNV